MNAFISCSELLCDKKKKCHSTELHLFAVQFSFHLFRIYLLEGFPKFEAYFFFSEDLLVLDGRKPKLPLNKIGDAIRAANRFARWDNDKI